MLGQAEVMSATSRLLHEQYRTPTPSSRNFFRYAIPQSLRFPSTAGSALLKVSRVGVDLFSRAAPCQE